MFSLIKYSNYKKMPWKNGKGITFEIDVDTHEKYLWRLSMALINEPAPFSQYINYDRFLTLWKGESVLLNEFILRSGVIHSFPGEKQIFCQKTGSEPSEVIDVGFIFQRDLIKANMKIAEFNSHQTLNLMTEFSFVFCAKGVFQVEDIQLVPGDTLKIVNEKKIYLTLKTSEVQLFIIEFDII